MERFDVRFQKPDGTVESRLVRAESEAAIISDAASRGLGILEITLLTPADSQDDQADAEHPLRLTRRSTSVMQSDRGSAAFWAFRRFVAPGYIRGIFKTNTVLVSLVALAIAAFDLIDLVTNFSQLNESQIAIRGVLALAPLIGGIVYLLVLRIVLESLIILFRINEQLSEINRVLHADR